MNILKTITSLFSPKPVVVSQPLPKTPKLVMAGKLKKGMKVQGKRVASVEKVKAYRSIGYNQVRIHFESHGSFRAEANELIKVD